jgi:hypothetical protein
MPEVLKSLNPRFQQSSRLLNFSNLPEPKNSDGYYEENNNIISMEASGI